MDLDSLKRVQLKERKLIAVILTAMMYLQYLHLIYFIHFTLQSKLLALKHSKSQNLAHDDKESPLSLTENVTPSSSQAQAQSVAQF